MNIALIGFGKMGRLLEARALEAGSKVIAIVDLYVKDEKSPFGNPILKSLVLKEKPDLAFEFTRPDMAVNNLLFLAKEKIPTVTGTTGWYDKLPEISAAVKEAGTSLFYAPNYSLGMNLFYRIAAYAAEILDPFVEYDVGGLEIHHNKKADSPSGTAKALVDIVLGKMSRKKKVVYDKLDRPPAAEELHFASLRKGSEPGFHSISFDSPADTIELIHNIKNRDGLVSGALMAAEWLYIEKRSGVFSMDDMLADLLQKRGFND